MKEEANQFGKKEQFVQIYHATFDRLYNYCIRTFADHDMVDDVLQEGYMKLWLYLHEKNIAELKQEDFTKQLYGYVRSKLANEKSKKDRRKLLEKRQFREDDLQGDMEDEIDNREYRLQLDEVVKQLPPKCRQIYRLYNEEGLTYDAIGKRLSISNKTVGSHLAKAAKTVTKRLRTLYSIGKFVVFTLSWTLI